MNKTSVLIAGDFCPINRTEKAILDGKSNEMISGIRHRISKADISVINLEAPLTDREQPILKTGPNLKGRPGCVDFLKKSGFSLVNTANNHILDHGSEGYTDTISLLDDSNLRHVGSGMNLCDARKEEVFNIEGMKIAFLAFAENEYTVAQANTPGASPVDPYFNIVDIKRVSDENHHTIVMVHGGNEYNPIPSPGMKKRYRMYIEAGASSVIAMHTHCPQGHEMYKGCPIVYSLGNFLFDTPYEDREYREDDFWWKGYMALLGVSKEGIELGTIPIEFGPDGTAVRETRNRKPFDEYIEYLNSIIQDDEEKLKYWKAWCLMKGPWWTDNFSKLEFPFDRNDRESLLASLIMRNGHSCEAHNELITTFWKMAAHDDIDGYDEYIRKIGMLQKGIIPD